MVAEEKGAFHGKLMTSCDPDYVNIDVDNTDPQQCSLYAADIYTNLRVAEVCGVDIILLFLQHSCLSFLLYVCVFCIC